jgi:23S rRNA pseudouridine2604 synthase
MTEIRLSKLMTERGICSRREADRYIEAGQVVVNGQVVNVLGTKVPQDSTIELKSAAAKWQSNKVTIILNKPVGYVSTQPEKGYIEAVELIVPENQFRGRNFQSGHLLKLAVAGRLDIDSKGLLILTQDGTLAKKLIGPESSVEKEYLVYVDGYVSKDALSRLKHGLSLDAKPLKRAKVEAVKPNLLRVVLTEGKKRQIRRMCEAVGLEVTGLKRIRIGRVELGDLPEGKWRYLAPGETF